MATRTAWSIAIVELSDSFRVALNELAAELQADLLEWSPQNGTPPTGEPEVIVLLAGGAEAAALDLLSELPASSAPRRRTAP